MGFFDSIFNSNPYDKYGRVPKNIVDFVRAADAGEEWALRQVGQKNLSYEEIALARLQIYHERAERGDQTALLKIGMSLSFFDPQESLKILEDLANKGNIEAMKTISLEYSDVGSYETNPTKEFEWNLRAAEAGDAEAQTSIGLEYKIERSYEDAEYWYGKAAAQNHPPAMVGLADIINTKRTFLYNKKDELDNIDEVRKKYLEEEENLLIEAINTSVENRNTKHYIECSMKLGSFYRYDNEPMLAMEYYYNVVLIGDDVDQKYAQKYINEIESEFNVILSEREKERIRNSFA